MTSQLFRPEVAAQKARRAQGTIALMQPLKSWVLTTFVLSTALCIACVLIFGQYTKRAHVAGVILPTTGLVDIVAQSDGVVESVYVQEGDWIAKKSSVVAIGRVRGLRVGDANKAMQIELRNRSRLSSDLLDARLGQLDGQLERLRGQIGASAIELKQIQQSIATRAQRAILAQDALRRYEAIGDKLVSEVAIVQQREEVLAQLEAKQLLERQATELRRSIAGLRQDLDLIPIERKALIAAADRDNSLLRKEQIAEESANFYKLQAPVNGSVAARMVEVGQAVKIGQPLLTMVPAGSLLEAELMIPSSAVGFVRVDDVVLLRYDAFPFQKFGHQRGRVKRISRSAVASQRDSAGQQQLYRVLVRLDSQTIKAYGNEEPILPGMRFQADILGETRHIYEWVLEPLYSVSGSL